MSTLLEQNLDEIIRLKNKYCIPENIKSGIEILGVTGILNNSVSDDDIEQIEAIVSRILGEG